MEFGLSSIVLQKIRNIISLFPQVEEVIVYGSRAKGNYKPASDIDITLQGKKLNLSDLNKLALMLDDLLLPQKFDISIFRHITNPDLIAHIQRVGKPLKKSSLITAQ